MAHPQSALARQVHVGTVRCGDWKADIYSTSLPGEFKLTYLDPSGKPVEESQLTGVSTYKLRESEILDHLRALSSGKTSDDSDLQDAGEY